ncbi:hypothetical protein [Pseudomaricurvus sp. HS19]|uniref:hypothetical protein n=1 Tax=Pseudomaricurvus sp. HS19 TaxID=2692626 RepID=UPI00136B0874|nr:hypothetical protein [Pseudomaricurvus sp. HS19]MYM64223.1 hypothetical protein [Pseudomaricurvus sp. HS19]
MTDTHTRWLPALFLALTLPAAPHSQAQDLLIIDEDSDDASLTIEDDSDSLIIDDGSSGLISEEAPRRDNSQVTSAQTTDNGLSFKLDPIRLEAGVFDTDSTADYQGYAHITAILNWQSGPWELQGSVRGDAFEEEPDNNNQTVPQGEWNDADLDYDETFVRYKGESGILTLGAQRVLWGRIDEVPPSDKLSTQDLRRGLLDDLEDRRLASAAVRYEHFIANGKLDLLYLPRFRESELPGQDSVWYPINRREGTILGLDTTAQAEFVVRNAPISDRAPDTDGGGGLRFSQLGDGFDYAVTLQRGIGTQPYFAFNPASGRIEARYLRSTTVGADAGFEALGGTLKLEAAWNSDTPVTRSDGRFDSVESVAWGVALELFPGDGDARVNLQVTGNQLLGAPSVMDRDEMVSLNGSLEMPFANNQWRARLRFNAGLDKEDLYINPELTYTGLRNQEIYLEAHAFDGEKGSVGGFYEEDSLLTLGWRASL